MGTDVITFTKITGNVINASGSEASDKTGTFTTFTKFVYPGSNHIGTLHRACTITREGSGVTTEVRLQDITNSLTIASVTTTEAATDHISELTITVSNIPTEIAIFEVQFRRATGTGNNSAFTSGLTLESF